MPSRTSTQAIRVVIVDDHPLLREGLAVVLEQDPSIEIVASVEDARGALSAIATFQPDVAIIDLRLPDGDGADVCAHVQAEYPRVGLLVFTRSTGEHFVMKAFRSGADGYAVKSADAMQILTATRVVAGGDSYIDPLVADCVIDTATAGKRPEDPHGLTRQERRAVELAATGMKNRQVAVELELSVETVKTHLRHAMRKLGVDDRGSLAGALQRDRDDQP